MPAFRAYASDLAPLLFTCTAAYNDVDLLGHLSRARFGTTGRTLLGYAMLTENAARIELLVAAGAPPQRHTLADIEDAQAVLVEEVIGYQELLETGCSYNEGCMLDFCSGQYDRVSKDLPWEQFNNESFIVALAQCLLTMRQLGLAAAAARR